MRTKALAVALLGAFLLLPGCVFSLGGSNKVHSEKTRIERLEQRIQTMEDRMGIEPPLEEWDK